MRRLSCHTPSLSSQVRARKGLIERTKMGFSDKTKERARARAGNRCECKRSSCTHKGRCPKLLNRGRGEFNHVTSVAVGGSDGLENCELLCVECHRNTRSYGRSPSKASPVTKVKKHRWGR